METGAVGASLARTSGAAASRAIISRRVIMQEYRDRADSVTAVTLAGEQTIIAVNRGSNPCRRATVQRGAQEFNFPTGASA
jgi:hypothetical protein